ncbi:MAG: hypothetical protein ACTSPY_08215 [Candidatus Helarchaeota archaeon]
MSETTKYCIMLKITQGKSDRLTYKIENLRDSDVVAIMDEVHGVIWLWMGSNTGLVQRRGAMRVAQSLKTYGHTIGPTIVGKSLSDVVHIDGRTINSDSVMAGRFNKVKELFQIDHNIEADVLGVYKAFSTDTQPSYYGLSKEQRDNLVQAALSTPAVGEDDRSIEEIVGQYRPPPSTKETPAPAPTPAVSSAPSTELISDELVGDVKASIIISSVLTQLNDLFVSVGSGEGGKKIYTVENADGLVCKFQVDGTNIKFLPGSWELVDKESKTKIQKVFIDRTKLLLKFIK